MSQFHGLMNPLLRCATFLLILVSMSTSALSESAASDRDEYAVTSEKWRKAISGDDAEQLSAVLRAHAGSALGKELPGTTASNGKTALMVAAKSGDLALAEALVREGSELDAVTATGGTAMMFAALGENTEVAQWLFLRGAAVDDVGSNGWTTMTIAAARGFSPMVSWLLSVEAVAAPVDVYGYTPLMRAVENGHEDAASILLDAGAERINHQDEFGNTALHHASRAGREDLVMLLVAAGADGSITNRDGQLALAVDTR